MSFPADRHKQPAVFGKKSSIIRIHLDMHSPNQIAEMHQAMT